MTARVIAVLVALPLLTTMLAVARTVSNRSSGREAIVLSLREAVVGRRGSPTAALSVRLVWSGSQRDDRRIEAGRRLKRRTYVALTLNRDLKGGESRLVAVDWDPDPEVLARRYPDGGTHIISRATMMEDGHVGRLDPSFFLVPRDNHTSAMWPDGDRRASPGDAYAVTVRYGRHWEPWVVDVRPVRRATPAAP